MRETMLAVLLLTANMAQALIACHFLIRFTGATNKPLYYVTACLVFLCVDILAPYMPNDILNYLLLLPLLALFTFFLLKRALLPAVTGALVVVVLLCVLGNIGASIMSIASTLLPASSVAVISLVQMGGMLFLSWLFLSYIGRRFSFDGDEGFPYIFTLWFPLIMIFLFSGVFGWATIGNVVVTDAFGFGHIQARLAISGWWVLAIFLAALFCIFVLFFSYQRFRDYYAGKQQKERLEQELSWHKTAIAEAAARHDKTKAFRHDLGNHLNVLSGLLKNGEYKAAQAYLDQIGSFAGELRHSVASGNAILDVLLSEKIEMARQSGIEVSCEASVGEGIDGYDLCVLVGNALDNAIRACEALPAGKRRIVIGIGRIRGFVHIRIVNTKGEKVRGGEGYGIKNMRAIVKKYNGGMETADRGETYELDAVLALPLQEQGNSLQNHSF